MKISLDWMKELVAWQDDPETLARKLTSAGLNVEGIERYEQSFPGVVVARVVHREQHPDADRLSLCRVDDGSGQEVQVVCGAPNVREGITVLFGRVGAELPGDFVLKKTRIRGVDSFGMICSAAELRLAADADGIMELDTDLPPGTPADELYGFRDVVLDIEVTPNRPDWLNHVGIAREIGAIYGTKVSLPRCWSSQQSAEQLGLKVQIQDFADCERYTAFAAKEVTIGPSPKWMQDRLRAVGSRPINNVVDITNYVMLEMGQPMHAFDQARINGETISIRRGHKGDKVVTLDDQERELAGDHLLVCDAEGPIALAGVMGLANSEVTEETTDIILESASFAPQLVREASRALNLISESSYRFERGVDWSMVEKAAHRALYLMQEHAGARIVSDWAERADPDHKPHDPVPLRTWQVNRVLGTELKTGDIAQTLQNLGLKVQPMGNAEARGPSAVNMMVEVPSFRSDLLQEVDLIEEVARCHGYDNLAGGSGFARREGNPRRRIDLALQQIRTWFAHNGFQEMVTSSFYHENDLQKLGLIEDDPRTQTLSVVNPNHGGDTSLRTTLLPSLLHVARQHLNSGAPAPVRLFQNNRVYLPALGPQRELRHEAEKQLPHEPLLLQFGIAGKTAGGLDSLPGDLRELKGVLEELSAALRVPLALVEGGAEGWYEDGAQWTIQDRAGAAVGTAGRVRGDLAERFDLDAPVSVAEIDLTRLDLSPEPVEFRPFARFPGMRRDLSLLVPEAVRYGQIEEVVTETGGPLLTGVELFDVYRGKGVPAGQGAYGIRLKFRSEKGNLKGKAVDKAVATVVRELSDRLQIKHRSSEGTD